MASKKSLPIRIKRPEGKELTIRLIKEELKSRKFFNGMAHLGLDDCYFQPHLDDLILTNMGLDPDSDETFAFYFNVIEKHSAIIEADKNSITEEAHKVYEALEGWIVKSF